MCAPNANIRKKCDEKHPKCGNCVRRGEECTWPTNSKSDTEIVRNEIKEHIRVARSLRVRAIDQESGLKNALVAAEIAVDRPHLPGGDLQFRSLKLESDFKLDSQMSDFLFEFDSVVIEELQGFKDDLTLFQMELDEQRSEAPSTQAVCYSQKEPEILYKPSVASELANLSDLDAEAILFYETYKSQYCNLISVGLPWLNYFIKTFVGQAQQCTGVAYAIVAWGGFFLELQKPKCDFIRPWVYMQKAAKAMCEQLGPELKLTKKESLISLFSFYLVFVGIEVCTGDVHNWRGFMNQCFDLIQLYHGPVSLSKAFDNCNDIKFLLSNFCLHDILSSRALTERTFFPMSQYEAIVSASATYGLDPLHGIVGPVYLIFGHIGNHKAALDRQWEDVHQKLVKNHPEAETAREKYYDEVDRVTNAINVKMKACKPSPVHLELLKEHPKTRDVQLGLFELYMYTCQMQLGMSIQKLPLNAVSQQRLLLKAQKLLDVLLEAPVKVSLSLLILVCGILCCTERDRTRMTSVFRRLLNQYKIGNLQRIEETVIEAWELSPEGTMCLDWAELVSAKNWQLFVG